MLHAIADVDEHLGDAVAADLGRNDDVLPRVHGAVHRNRARELDALERRRRDGHDGLARAGGRGVVLGAIAARGRTPATTMAMTTKPSDAAAWSRAARCMEKHVELVLD